MDPVTIVVPTKTRDYLHNFLASLNAFQPGWQHNPSIRVVVADNGLDKQYLPHLQGIGVKIVGVPDPFCFAQAVNSAVLQALPHSHLVVMNDDAAFTSVNPVTVAAEAVERALARGYGLIGARVNGGVGNPDQKCQDIPIRGFLETQGPICFVCAIIPRPVWDEIGVLDDQFTGYGFEDTDYCFRVLKSGRRLGVTGDVVVSHGLKGHPFQSTFAEKYDGAQLSQHSDRNKRKFIKKWGSLQPVFGRVTTGGTA